MTVFSKHHLAAALALGAAVFVVAPAFGQGLTGNLSLNVTVNSNCALVNNPSIGFNAYTSGSDNLSSGTATIQVSGCPEGTLVMLGEGANFEDNFRRLKKDDGNEFLNYKIFSDNYTTEWSTDGVPLSAPDQFDGSASILVRARVEPTQWISPGTYSDTLVITLQFP